MHGPPGADHADRRRTKLLTALNRTHAAYYAEPNPTTAGCIELGLTRRAPHRAACRPAGSASARAAAAAMAASRYRRGHVPIGSPSGGPPLARVAPRSAARAGGNSSRSHRAAAGSSRPAGVTGWHARNGI